MSASHPWLGGTGSNEVLVSLEGAVVVFDGFKALDIDRFAIREREIRVIIGPNGAGKTTLCDVISGRTRLTAGRCLLGGSDITRLQDFEIARRGVGRKFQTPTVFGSLTVRENLELAGPPSGGSPLARLFRRPDVERRRQIDEAAATVGIGDVLDVEAQYLSHGQRQLLEIAALLIARPRLLLVDEPAAGLSDAETAAMGRLLRQLAEDHTVMVIEHDMDFVRALDAEVTVLNEGRILAEGPMALVQSDPRVIEAYLGR